MFHKSNLFLAGVLLASSLVQAQTSSQTSLTESSAPRPVLHEGQTTPLEISSTPDDEPKEDWTTIYLAKSNLPLDSTGSFLLNKVDMPGGCVRELERLQWRHGDPIDLYVIQPPQPGAGRPAGKLPVVLFLYNYTYDTELFRQDRWCDVAKRNGYAIAGFGSALSWQRFHAPRPLGKWFVSELQEALSTSTHDVQMVLNYLQTRGDVDVSHVGMFGQGSGGAIAILAAAADPRISALDLMDPWGDWPDWVKGSKQIPEEERATYLKADFLQRVQTLDPIDYLPHLTGRQIHIQQLTTDGVTPAAASARIAAAAPSPDEVMRYEDMATEVKALGSNGIVGWLGEQVHPGVAHASTTPETGGRP